MVDAGAGGSGGGLAGRPYPRPLPAAERPLLMEFVRVFATRLKLFVAVAVVVMLVTVIQMMRATKIYRAQSEVLIERQHSRLGSLDDPVQVDTLDTDYYNTQFKILEGPGLAKSTHDRLMKTGREDFKSRDLLHEIMVGVEVVWARNNRVVQARFYHPDPKLAAEILNALVLEYMNDTRLRRQKTIDALTKDMEEELKKVKESLDRSEEELLTFNQKQGLLIGEERTSQIQRLMDETAAQLARQEAELTRLESAVLKVAEPDVSVEQLAGLPEIGDNLTLRDLRLEEGRAMVKLDEARRAYGPQSQELQAALGRVDEIRRAIEQHLRMLASGLVLRRDALQESVQQLTRRYDDIRKSRIAQDALLSKADVLRRNRDANRTLYDTMVLRINESKISSNIELTNVHVLHEAEPPSVPVKPNLMLSLLMGVIIAFLAGASVTLLMEKVDNTIRTPDEVETNYGVPVLSVVPERRDDASGVPPAIVCWQDERSQMAEAYRRLRAAVLLSVRTGEGGSLRRILFCSPGPSEGKTVSSVNLAITLAQMGSRTLLLDTDFYRSETHKLFGVDREKGLSTVLTSDVPIAQVINPTPVPFLDYMATGMIPPQPASLLGSARMKWLLDELSRTYNRIVMDASPLVAVTDATMLVPHVDALILAVYQGKTLKTALRRAIQTLSRIGVRPLGVLFNGMKIGVGEFYFRYHHPSYVMDEAAEGQPIESERNG